MKMVLWSPSGMEYQNSFQPPVPLRSKYAIAAHINLNGLVDQESQLENPRQKFLPS